jgi:PhoPQ-activated pathogenicity-related protein
MLVRLFAAAGAALLLSAAPPGPTTGPAPNPLERYVAQADPTYGWTLARTIPGQGYTAYVLDLTSQTWRKPNEVDRTVWKHWLTIVKPDRVLHDKALLYIDGGNNGDPAPAKASDRALQLALNTNSVVAELGMVPNQPLRFPDSPTVARYEDDLIAHVQNKQLATKDDEWILRMAMVKSGVRAMDAMQAFMAGETAGRTKLNTFVVSGGSKRGWTA